MPVRIVQRIATPPAQSPHFTQSRQFSITPAVPASDYHDPNTTNSQEETVYTVSLSVSPQLHESMNHLRSTYFPKKLNRLSAHLTLFHALPGSELEARIIPVIDSIAAKTPCYPIEVGRPVRMKHGILLPARHMGEERLRRTEEIHKEMKRNWEQFLSRQDRQGLRLHWTIMNKVDDSGKVDKAEREVGGFLRSKQEQLATRSEVEGFVTGLVLWRYDHGRWKEPREFKFQRQADDVKV